MNLQEFDARLREITANDSRPFLCDGSPLDCRVFIVGLNPRTHTPFWDFWDVSYGCRKQQWLEAYLKREGKLGRTRKYIEILLDSLVPYRCLETNLYAAWSNRIADLPVEYRTTKVFDFLIRTIRPQLLLIHGRKAISHVENLANCVLPLNELHRVQFDGNRVDIYARHHLSFQFSKQDCRSLGERLRKHVFELQSYITELA